MRMVPFYIDVIPMSLCVPGSRSNHARAHSGAFPFLLPLLKCKFTPRVKILDLNLVSQWLRPTRTKSSLRHQELRSFARMPDAFFVFAAKPSTPPCWNTRHVHTSQDSSSQSLYLERYHTALNGDLQLALRCIPALTRFILTMTLGETHLIYILRFIPTDHDFAFRVIPA